MSDVFRIGFLVYPHVTQLDFTGPAQFFARMSNVELHYVWKSTDPIMSDAGLSLNPTDTFASCPTLDLICVPGGAGQRPLMTDPEVLLWLGRQGAQARFVTSVCSGALLLGAAGLLKGYEATTHWAVRDFLPHFGAKHVAGRVVMDRNRITGGGVTAGIDFALFVIEQVRGVEEAKAIQLLMEYDPSPKYDCGVPERATLQSIDAAKGLLQAMDKSAQTN